MGFQLFRGGTLTIPSKATKALDTAGLHNVPVVDVREDQSGTAKDLQL